MNVSLFLFVALALHYGDALKCYSCGYNKIDSAEDGDKGCDSPGDDTPTQTCPSSAKAGYEFRCMVEDVNYQLESARYRYMTRKCVEFEKDTPMDPPCSTDKKSSVWSAYGQYKGSVSGGLANFLDAVNSISGNVCTCKTDLCNHASGHVTASMAAILVSLLAHMLYN